MPTLGNVRERMSGVVLTILLVLAMAVSFLLGAIFTLLEVTRRQIRSIKGLDKPEQNPRHDPGLRR